LTTGLHSIAREIDALHSKITQPEPEPSSPSLRERFGLWLKRRLYGLLWWQVGHLQATVELLSRWNREEIAALDSVVASIPTPPDTSQRDRDFESRLQWVAARGSQSTLDLRLQIERLETDCAQRRAEWEKRVEQLQSVVEESAGRLRQSEEKLTSLTQQLTAAAAQRVQLNRQVSELGIYTHQTRAALSLQDRRLDLLFGSGREHDAEKTHGTLASGQPQRTRFDDLYSAFEDIMRGSREDVKERQRIYIPVLQENSIGSESMPILDLGCGRGEWLEVLRENGMYGSGVDSNEAMVQRSRSLGLHVAYADALAHLRSLPGSSLGAVTAFHMVEHMPFDIVLAVVDEGLRVLRPGGLLILETPNPANLLVGANTFYLDPTHLKPYPSPMLHFFVEARGFSEVRVLDLHPYPAAVHLPDDTTGVAARLNTYLYGPQDYAVLGRKL
jgi:SAM-dependent methyltransferase